MDVRILGCYGGIVPGYRTTNFLVNGTTAVDAGALVYTLSFEEQTRIRHIFITHSHLDHTTSLPFLIDNVFGMIDAPVNVYSIAPVIEAIRAHLFNDVTWPDFSRIPDEESAFLRFHVIEPRVPVEIDGVRYTPIPVNHIVPCVGYVMEDDRSAVIFTSDTGPCREIYDVANRTPNLKAFITEVSFPNELAYIAELSRHLTPRLLAAELTQLKEGPDVFLYHLKPPYIDQIHVELAELALPFVRCLDQDQTYRF
jgi:ribonuclease BN (tRNA processing enzyme)